MARILAQAGLRAVDEHGNDATDQAARRRLEAPAWHLWPSNVRTWRLWYAVQTQWRAGMAGATGLDYTAVWAVLDRSGLPRRCRQETFEHLQAMERATLEVWAQRAERDRSAKR